MVNFAIEHRRVIRVLLSRCRHFVFGLCWRCGPCRFAAPRGTEAGNRM